MGAHTCRDCGIRTGFTITSCAACGSPDIRVCTCGSGAHPRRCATHPSAYQEHLDELSRDSQSPNCARARIVWLSAEEGGRKTPIGPNYCPIVRFDADPDHSKHGTNSLVVDIERNVGHLTDLADVRFLADTGPTDLLYPGATFQLMEGSRVVANGTILNENEEPEMADFIRTRFTDDEKDPNYRLRLEQSSDPKDNILLVEEQTTSRTPSAQPLKDAADTRLWLTLEEAVWLHQSLGDLFRRQKS